MVRLVGGMFADDNDILLAHTPSVLSFTNETVNQEAKSIPEDDLFHNKHTSDAARHVVLPSANEHTNAWSI